MHQPKEDGVPSRIAAWRWPLAGSIAARIRAGRLRLKFTAVGERETESLWNATAGFFAVVPFLAAGKVMYSLSVPNAYRPNFLVWWAVGLAACGLPLSLVARRRAKGAAPAGLPWYFSAEAWSTFAVFTAFLGLYAITGVQTAYNEQVFQAVAFLHGHTYVNVPSVIEHAQIGRYSYALHPPLSAILLIPLVAIWGLDTNEMLFSLVVGVVGMALVWRLLNRFGLRTNARVWLAIFFGAGTTFWCETVMGNTWSLPETVSVCFTVAALIEVFGQARPFWLGVFSALACFARYDQALAVPIFALIAWLRGRKISELLWMAPGFIVVGIAFVGFNEARFNSFFDQGVALTGPKNAPAFGLRYLPGNLYTVFLLAPNLSDHFPYIRPTYGGQCLALTSPAFVLAFRASLKRAVPALMLLAAGLASLPSLLCYANGFAQFGTRHYVQVYPFLLVMMAIGMRRGPDQLVKVLTVASTILVAYGIWHFEMWGWT
ncbi:MAG: hypothetical protein ACREQI_12040 [Candidatus Binataceae bacterium]